MYLLTDCDITQEKKQEYKNLGHGTYDTITNEKEFFEISKKSDRVVCLFYIDTSFRFDSLLCWLLVVPFPGLCWYILFKHLLTSVTCVLFLICDIYILKSMKYINL